MLNWLKEFIRDVSLELLRKAKPYRSWAYIPSGTIQLSTLRNYTSGYIRRHNPIRRKRPLTPGAGTYWKFERLLNETPEPVFVIAAEGWRVWGNQGAVITNEGKLFKNVSREFEKPHHSIFKQLRLIPYRELPGTTAVITCSGCGMYYHWMFDALPRFGLLNDAGFDTGKVDQYIIDYSGMSFQKEAIARLEIPESKISKANDHFSYHILASRLLVPSLPSQLDTASAAACTFLVNLFLEPGRKSRHGKNIYLKRSGKRIISNAEEIEEFIESQGFETVQCENYSIADQAAIFHHADVIIGPHGAAFTNTVFCRPGAKVIEFFSPRWINPCYWTICEQVGADYYYLVGEGPPPDRHSDATGANVNIDLRLDELKGLFKNYQIA
jgi:capsular polysaccharide biosynthesis protein